MLDTYGELDMWLITTPKVQTTKAFAPILAPTLAPTLVAVSTSVILSKSIPVSIPAPALAPVLEPNDATKKPVSKKSIQHKPIIMSKKCMTLEDKKREKARERGRIQAQRHRDRRKAEFLSLIKYSESLQEHNQSLKTQICTLKQQLNELIIRYKHKQDAKIKI